MTLYLLTNGVHMLGNKEATTFMEFNVTNHFKLRNATSSYSINDYNTTEL